MLTRTSSSGRKTLLSTALISAGLIGLITAATARQTPSEPTHRTYRIAGELSEADILALWPPARHQARLAREPNSGRRYYRSYGTTATTPLGEWVPEQSMPEPGTRLRQDEERMKLLKDMKDRDGDGVPDRLDVYPWNPTRW